MFDMYGYSFIQHALVVGVFGGGMLAFLGVLVHLRRVVFMGAALPQLLGLGTAMAWWVGLAPFIGAVAAGLLGILLLSRVHPSGRLGPESWVGLVFAGGGAFAIIFLAISDAPDGRILRLFTGDILGTSRTDAVLAVVAAVVVGVLFKLFWSRIVMSSFDPVMVRALGLRVGVWDLCLFLSVVTGTVIVMHSAGSLLAFGMLVGPSAGALLLFRSLPKVVLGAVIGGMAAAWLGLTASFAWDLPGGPSMAAAALLPVPLALLIIFLQRILFRRG